MIQDVAVSDEKMDYLREVMNVAAGNAVTAFSQFLDCDVDIAMPNVLIMPVMDAAAVFKSPDSTLICVRMDMVGDVRGRIFFILPDEQRANLLTMARNALPAQLRKTMSLEINVLEEVGNIIVGVFLSAVHDFTRLNIYHTVPVLVIDQILPMIDVSLSSHAGVVDRVLVVECEFEAVGGKLKTMLFLVMGGTSMDAMLNSIDAAREAIRGA